MDAKGEILGGSKPAKFHRNGLPDPKSGNIQPYCDNDDTEITIRTNSSKLGGRSASKASPGGGRDLANETRSSLRFHTPGDKREQL